MVERVAVDMNQNLKVEYKTKCMFLSVRGSHRISLFGQYGKIILLLKIRKLGGNRLRKSIHFIQSD